MFYYSKNLGLSFNKRFPSQMHILVPARERKNACLAELNRRHVSEMIQEGFVARD